MLLQPDNSDSHYYRDDGSEINPELVSKPTLCVTCVNDDDHEEEIVCILTRAGSGGRGTVHMRCVQTYSSVSV